MVSKQLAHVLLAALLALAGVSSETTTPLVIADGGSSCQVPEQTVQAFKLAIENGADFLGITVVSTKDGALVCRPDITLDGNTNIAQDKALRGRESVQTLPDGRKKAGHFVSDYTLAEVQTLWAVQDFADRDQSFNSDFRVPELKDVLELVSAAVAGGRKLGIAVHVKEPQYHQAINVNLEQAIISAITAAGFSADKFPTEVILTSFYLPVLEALRSELDTLGVAPKASLVWKIDCSEGDVSDADLDAFAAYGAGIAPEKELLEQLTFAEECGKLIMPPCWKTGDHCTGKLQHPYNPDADAQPTTLLSRAHDRGLKVYPYTFRNEARFMAVDFHADMQKELSYFAGPKGMGVDGMYLDCPSSGVQWLAGLQYAAKRAAQQNGGSPSPALSPSPKHNAAPLLGAAVPANDKSPAAAAAPAEAPNSATPAVAPAVDKTASDAAVAAASSPAPGTTVAAVPALGNASSVSAGTDFKQAFTDKVPLWTLAVTAGGVVVVLLLGLCLARCTRNRRTDSYRQFKSSLRDPLETADLPVSTGAEWGLQKSRWGASRTDRGSDTGSEMEAPPSTMSQGSRNPNNLATYSGFLRKYTDMTGGQRQPPP